MRGEYGLQPHKTEAWEASLPAYVKIMDDHRLNSAKMLGEYLGILRENAGRYTALIAVRGDDVSELGEADKEAFRSLGLATDLAA